MGRINYYIAVFIDILGQGEKLSKIKRLPETKEEEEEFFKLFRETTGAVKGLHKTFNDFFNGYQKIGADTQNWLDTQSEDIQEKFLRSRELKLQYLNFSDTVVLYFTLDKENSPTPLRNIYTALSSSASTFLMMMSMGVPIRGSIEVGIGTIIDNSGLYGPLLQKLHYLESEVAKYPRVIVGDELIRLIETFETNSLNDDIFVKMDRAILPSIKELITKDVDGQNILHYLDKEISESLEPEPRKKIYTDLSEFVDQQCDSFQDSETLSERYQLLQKYVRDNQANWNVPNKLDAF